MRLLTAVVPTGVGAGVGGFAGDATPAMRVLAGACDHLLVNPNALNAAVLFAPPPNAHYVEGAALDGFLAGRWVLKPGAPQRLGVVVDAAVDAMPPGTWEAHLNAFNAARAVFGARVVGIERTAAPLGCALETAPSGASAGRVERADALLDAARALVARGATAIAVFADLGAAPEGLEEAYMHGGGVDPIGGLEAILSHAIVHALGVPAAHAPLWPYDFPPDPVVDPRAAAESLGFTYAPCVLAGLMRHPALVPPEAATPDCFRPGDVTAFVAPAGCLGGAGALAAAARGVPLVEVTGNPTRMGVGGSALGAGVERYEARSYMEAAGLAIALGAGIDPAATLRPLPPLVQPGQKAAPESCAGSLTGDPAGA